MGSVPAVIRSRDRVNNGTLHRAVIVREENTGSVQVDGGRRVMGTTRGGDLNMQVRRTPVYLGGAPRNSRYLPPAKLYKTPFKGCIHSMRVDNKKVKTPARDITTYPTIKAKLLGKIWAPQISLILVACLAWKA